MDGSSIFIIMTQEFTSPQEFTCPAPGCEGANKSI